MVSLLLVANDVNLMRFYFFKIISDTSTEEH